MLNQLKKIFPSLISGNETNQTSATDYQWFTTSENEIVGINKNELDHKKTALLELILTPYYGAHPPTTDREKAWYHLLFDDPNDSLKPSPVHYRFVYFSMSEPLQDPNDFREAIDGLYPQQTAIIWGNQQQGIIIEEEKPTEEDNLSYEEMVEVFTSDFFIDVKLYVGPFLTSSEQAPAYYRWIKTAFDQTMHFNTKSVMTYVTSVPYLLSTLTTKDDDQLLIDAILKDTRNDEELLRTIQTFLECNSNTSLAAKEMYMHRNSLQYRIDKFIEKTEIDVKRFEGALSVYLILLLKNR